MNELFSTNLDIDECLTRLNDHLKVSVDMDKSLDELDDYITRLNDHLRGEVLADSLTLDNN